MINVLGLQNQLMEQPEYILQIIEALDVEDVKDRGKYISFKNNDGDNSFARTLYKDTLKYINWTRSIQGNIFSLVMQERHCSFGQALHWISKITGIKAKDLPDIVLPFGGFYKKLLRDAEDEDEDAYIYKETDLPPANALSLKFLKDDIPLITQEKWGVRYSHEDDAVLIPIHDYIGRLVGCKARNNDSNCKPDQRWWAYFSYSKTKYLFGWHENYRFIQKKGVVFIVEAEKSVMILDGWDCHLGLAIGGHSFSRTQVRHIKSLMLNQIIVAFDVGISEDEMRYECQKLLPKHKLIETKVGYIFDRDNEVLKKGSKDAPVDRGKDNFVSLVKHSVTWLTG